MAKIIDPRWIDKRKEIIDAFLSPARISIPPVTTRYNPAAQWYIAYLDSKNLHCKVINLGAGVKKIIHVDNICTHCGGKGVI